MPFRHFLSPTPEAKDGFPRRLWRRPQIQRATLGHLADHDKVGGLTIILTVSDPGIILPLKENNQLALRQYDLLMAHRSQFFQKHLLLFFQILNRIGVRSSSNFRVLVDLKMCGMESVDVRDEGPGYGLSLNDIQDEDLAFIDAGQSLSPERVVTLLKKEGIKITVEKAGLILDFLDQLSNIIVSQYLRK
jgi:hypothetical protein